MNKFKQKKIIKVSEAPAVKDLKQTNSESSVFYKKPIKYGATIYTKMRPSMTKLDSRFQNYVNVSKTRNNFGFKESKKYQNIWLSRGNKRKKRARLLFKFPLFFYTIILQQRKAFTKRESFGYLRLFIKKFRKFKRRFIKKYFRNRSYFFRHYNCRLSIESPVAWVRKRKKFNFFNNKFLKKQYLLASSISLYNKSKHWGVGKKKRLRLTKQTIYFFKRRHLWHFRKKFLFFFKLTKKNKKSLLYNFLFFLVDKINFIKSGNLKLILLHFLFRKINRIGVLTKFHKKFKLYASRTVLFQYRRKLAKATRRYRVRFLRRKSKGFLGIFVKFRVKHRFFSTVLTSDKFFSKKKFKRVWVRRSWYLKGKRTSKGYWKTFQQSPIRANCIKFWWYLNRFVRKTIFAKDFSRRRWQTLVWLWRSKENRRRLRRALDSVYFSTNQVAFLRFNVNYFLLPSTFFTLFFSHQKSNSVSQMFEFDSYKFFVLNFLYNISVPVTLIDGLKLLPSIGFSSLLIAKNKFLLSTNHGKGAASFLAMYLLYKKQRSVFDLVLKLNQLRVHTKKRRISFLKKDINFVKLKRKIVNKLSTKNWFKFIKWRNWKRRFTPFLFKTLSLLNSFYLIKHLLLLSSSLRVLSKTTVETGGLLARFCKTSKLNGFSFINRWFYRNLGKKLKFPFKKNSFQKIRKSVLLAKRYSISSISRFKKKKKYKKNFVLTKKFSKQQFFDYYKKPFKLAFNHKKKKNLIYKFFSTRLAVNLFKTRRTLWSTFLIKGVLKKYKRRLYNRILQKIPVYERIHFRPWSRRWWADYTSRFITAEGASTLPSITTVLGISIKITLNNVFVGAVDELGHPFTVWSAGSVGFKGPTKKTTTAVDSLLDEVFNFAQVIGFDTFNIIFASSPANFLAKRFLGSFIQPFTVIHSVSFYGKLPHNGVRTKRQKRR